MPNGINEPEQFAGAKLTVRLHVIGVRPDGYHLLDAEMVSLDFGDTLEFRDGDGLEVTGPAATGVPASSDNLVLKALRSSGRTAHVTLGKVVPPGAGLGGGSSDAAAALRWAGITDTAVAAGVGADVPFCIRGGRARVTGVGDVLDPLPHVERVFTLLIPPFGVNTAAVYRAFDEIGGTAGGQSVNDLEPAALKVEPRLAEWRDLLAQKTGQAPVLAGSGSTWFVEGEWPPPAEGVGNGLWVVARTTPPLAID